MESATNRLREPGARLAVGLDPVVVKTGEGLEDHWRQKIMIVGSGGVGRNVNPGQAQEVFAEHAS